MVEGDMSHHDKANGNRMILDGIGMLTYPERVGTLRRPVRTTHEVGLHDVIHIRHAPGLRREVTCAVYLLKHNVLERRILPFYIGQSRGARVEYTAAAQLAAHA